MKHTAACLALLVVTTSLPAAAAKPGAFTAVPAAAGEKAQPFELRIVGYDGSTNGELVVEVRNRSKAAAKFVAQGLYFVPQLPADQAPQRLGAPGPLQTMSGQQQWQYADDATLAAGETRRLRLDVFCIDSHRASPTSQTPFALAGDRLPPELSRAITVDARKAAEKAGGYAAPAAKSSVQAEVWKNRDKDWIELEGEGVQEATK